MFKGEIQKNVLSQPNTEVWTLFMNNICTGVHICMHVFTVRVHSVRVCLCVLYVMTALFLPLYHPLPILSTVCECVKEEILGPCLLIYS